MPLVAWSLINAVPVGLSCCHAQAKAAEKQAARLESLMVERARDCPFRPQTNHQRRQEQLGRILAQPSYSESELAGAQRY